MSMPPAARSAMEAPAADPLALGLGGPQPAWSDDGRLPVDGSCVVGGPTGFGGTAVISRVESIPELKSPGAAAWFGKGNLRLAARLSDRGLAGYHENEFQLDVTRPARGGSRWGWGLTLGAGGWRAGDQTSDAESRADATGSSGWILGIAIGGRVGPSLALAARWLARGGGLAGLAPDRVELGAALDLPRGWRLALALDAGAPGQSWRHQAGLEWAITRQFAVRGGFRPADGQIGVGLSAGTGPIRLDIGRRTHPRLGSWTAIGITTGKGMGRRPAVDHDS
ncbi:MAG: hypothetical protein SGI90_13265 [Candidatus Eisenbacteria bacterium]|nr:hypothetical protein [Candidatus Eisenbacteria bacterium]